MLLKYYMMFSFIFQLVVTTPDIEKGCWPFNVVPYRIENGFSEEQRQFIVRQIGQLHRETCVRWVDVVEHALNTTDLVLFLKTDERTCFTDRKRTGSGYEARITLADVCFQRAGVLHEMLHVLGFGHEHQRADRDCYVTVNNFWVEATGKQFQFDVQPQEEWLEKFPYDKGSVMHYFRTIKMKSLSERWYTFEPLGNYESKLTEFDIWKIRYKFCNAPHFCDFAPFVCEIVDRAEQPCRASKTV